MSDIPSKEVLEAARKLQQDIKDIGESIKAVRGKAYSETVMLLFMIVQYGKAQSSYAFGVAELQMRAILTLMTDRLVESEPSNTPQEMADQLQSDLIPLLDRVVAFENKANGG